MELEQSSKFYESFWVTAQRLYSLLNLGNFRNCKILFLQSNFKWRGFRRHYLIGFVQILRLALIGRENSTIYHDIPSYVGKFVRISLWQSSSESKNLNFALINEPILKLHSKTLKSSKRDFPRNISENFHIRNIHTRRLHCENNFRH